jgi:hypothetical protein
MTEQETRAARLGEMSVLSRLVLMPAPESDEAERIRFSYRRLESLYNDWVSRGYTRSPNLENSLASGHLKQRLDWALAQLDAP